MRFIGDVHAKFETYVKLAIAVPESIQVGDFGAGFKNLPTLPITHRFIRGNDDLRECRKSPNFIVDGTYERDTMFIGGAYSIDKDQRREWIDWWPDEQVSYPELKMLIDQYEKNCPKIMVTHDCPEIVKDMCLNSLSRFQNRTQDAFNQMFDIHQPELWVFGHYHQNVDVVLNGTRFICLNELAFIDI